MKRLLTYLFLALGLGLMFTNFASALPECEGTDYSKWTNCQGTAAEEGVKYVSQVLVSLYSSYHSFDFCLPSRHITLIV